MRKMLMFLKKICYLMSDGKNGPAFVVGIVIPIECILILLIWFVYGEMTTKSFFTYGLVISGIVTVIMTFVWGVGMMLRMSDDQNQKEVDRWKMMKEMDRIRWGDRNDEKIS